MKGKKRVGVSGPERIGRSIDKKKRLGATSKVRLHLDQRLQALYTRAMLIEKELVRLDENRFYRACIFGSARIKQDSEIYKQAFELSRMLAWQGIDILTGGGPGLMEAANKGALLGRQEKKTKSLSYGLSIELPWEPEPNHHLDVKRHHTRFSSRLDDFMRLSNAIICTPGGIGTLLELFFAWQLVQVGHISYRPIVLMDKDFWCPLIDWMKKTVLDRGLISQKDFNSISLVDTPEEVTEIIAEDHKKFQLTKNS
jgi:uncharacterized protein (TIGR00730 family)